MRIRSDSALIVQRASRIESVVSAIDSRLSGLTARIDQAQPKALLEALDALPRLEAVRRQLREAVGLEAAALDDLEQVASLGRRIQGLEADGPELRLRIATLDARIAELGGRASELELRRAALQGEAALPEYPGAGEGSDRLTR